MSAPELRRVEDAFRGGTDAVEGMERLNLETISETLLRRGAEADSLDAAIATLRGIQTRLFLEGWLVRIDLPSARAWLSTQLDARAACAESGHRVLDYANPVRAALGALALYEELGPAELAQLSLSDLIDLSGPAQARPLRVACRAQLFMRRLDGASNDAPAFVREEKPGLASGAHMIRRRLRTMTEDVGLPVVRHWNPAEVESPLALAGRAGFRISLLDRSQRG